MPRRGGADVSVCRGPWRASVSSDRLQYQQPSTCSPHAWSTRCAAGLHRPRRAGVRCSRGSAAGTADAARAGPAQPLSQLLWQTTRAAPQSTAKGSKRVSLQRATDGRSAADRPRQPNVPPRTGGRRSAAAAAPRTPPGRAARSGTGCPQTRRARRRRGCLHASTSCHQPYPIHHPTLHHPYRHAWCDACNCSQPQSQRERGCLPSSNCVSMHGTIRPLLVQWCGQLSAASTVSMRRLATRQLCASSHTAPRIAAARSGAAHPRGGRLAGPQPPSLCLTCVVGLFQGLTPGGSAPGRWKTGLSTKTQSTADRCRWKKPAVCGPQLPSASSARTPVSTASSYKESFWLPFRYLAESVQP